MLETDDPAELIERAAMHEQLAAATHDEPARRMHLAMAAEYRRKAAALTVTAVRRPNPRMEMPPIAR